MIRNLRYRIDGNESVRRFRRLFDSLLAGNGRSYRRLLAIGFCVTVCLLYLGPGLLRWLFSSPGAPLSASQSAGCLTERLAPFLADERRFNVHIRRYAAGGQPTEPAADPAGGSTASAAGHPFLGARSQRDQQERFVPYVGNGYFGLAIQPNAELMIKSGRILALPVPFRPIVRVRRSSSASPSATVTDYQQGIVHWFQCFADDGFDVSYAYYAHRYMPSVFVQELQISNAGNHATDIDLWPAAISTWPTAIKQVIKLQHGSNIIEYEVVTGLVELSSGTRTPANNYVAVSIVSRKLPHRITLKKRDVTRLEILMTVQYSEPITADAYERTYKHSTEQAAIEAMRLALSEAQHSGHSDGRFRSLHTGVWYGLWQTGFEISASLAEDAINGDRINATVYAVLSNARTYSHEHNASSAVQLDHDRALGDVSGCYDSYHTLQADQLWRDMRTLDDLNRVVGSWMLTLEKQGCRGLLRAGARGVLQAMVLSLGGFRFSGQHLELNIHPRYLHRDYLYRRIGYDKWTRVNVSVAVTDDNKAVLWVALDSVGPSSSYYACDAGCLDEPVQLSSWPQQFPVKLTDPLTAILYITSDRQHMQELRHVIHVKEVVEAPAHEHHVIALHRHGHQLGGLPTLFWISICVIIVVFHVFLCKLIVKEYCEPPDKMRYRYSKP